VFCVCTAVLAVWVFLRLEDNSAPHKGVSSASPSVKPRASTGLQEVIAVVHPSDYSELSGLVSKVLQNRR
jgi:hypothetical protein